MQQTDGKNEIQSSVGRLDGADTDDWTISTARSNCLARARNPSALGPTLVLLAEMRSYESISLLEAMAAGALCASGA